MSSKSEEPNDEKADHGLAMNFQVADFPSDVLSIKRFRVLFPRNFDGPAGIDGIYRDNDFFFPKDREKPDHLMRLTELIADERMAAAGAFYRCFQIKYPEVLEEEDIDLVEDAKVRLEDNYQFFKLADSPEAARLLIRQVEEQGEKLARQDLARGR